MHLEDALAAAHVGQADHHAAVESAGPQQGGIEHIGAVGGGDEDHAVVRLEAVHLDEQLVEGLLALVVAASQAGTAVTPHCVDFVDEDDARVCWAFPCSNRSRTREAPTPTNISTKSEPD